MTFTPDNMISSTMAFVGDNVFFLELVITIFIFLFAVRLFLGSLNKARKSVFHK